MKNSFHHSIQPDCFDFNNYMESYHNHFKPFNPFSTEVLRIDRLIYLLSQVVVEDYQHESFKVLHGNLVRQSTEFEKEQEKEAFAMRYRMASTMVKKATNSLVSCMIG